MNLDAQNSTGVAEYDNDGNQVLGIDKIETYENDTYGRRIAFTADNNADGVGDYKEYYTLNVNGGWTEKRTDLTNNGSIDQKQVYTKNANDGTLGNVTYILDEQGGEHESSRNVYLLDEYGRSTAVINYGAGSDTPNYVEVYARDEFGRVVATYRDNGGDGNLITLGTDNDNNAIITQINGNQTNGRWTFTNNNGVDSINYAYYDEYGRVTRREYDNNSDGVIDNNNKFEYNVYGQMMRQLQDTDNNGDTNIIYEYDRDLYGREIESRKLELRDGEWTLTQRYYDYTYDAIGRWTERTIDRTGNGVTNDDVIYQREFDAAGNTNKNVYINALTNQISSVETILERDNANRVTKTYHDDPPSGESSNDYYLENVYNPSTGLNTFTKRINYNGAVAWQAEMEYHADNSIFRSYRDDGGNGVINRLNYGNQYAMWGTHLQDDLTQWDDAQIAKIKGGLGHIFMSSGTDVTLTIDAATVAKLAPVNNHLRIIGQADDTLHLSGFEKTTTSGNVTRYTAEVDGSTYTLTVDSAINTDTTVIGG